MLKKIGIITFQSSINYGAYLQAFSLAKAIKTALKIEVEIVNYTPRNKKLFYVLKVLASIRTGYFIKYLKQYLVFKKAQKNLPLSKPLKTNIYKKQCHLLNKNYFALVIGSDEVLTAGKTKARSFPNIYWPNHLVTIPKFTYAASANRSDYSKLSEKDKEIANSILENYKYIGVRDEHTHNQIINLNPALQPKLNCDPTFLVDFNSDYNQVREVLKEKFNKISTKPILALMTKSDAIGNIVKNYFGNEYFILSVYYPNKYADFFYADITPIEWAVAFSLYAGCISQLFHATVFSLKNKLPFVSFDNNPQYDERSTKISDILKKADLKENYFNLRDENFSKEKFLNQLKTNLQKPQTEKMELAVQNQKKLFNSFIKELKFTLALSEEKKNNLK